VEAVLPDAVAIGQALALGKDTLGASLKSPVKRERRSRRATP
jgi:hypothetical protein